MNLLERYSLECIKNITLRVEPGFSINEFIEKHGKNLRSITNGVNDQNFPLEQDFEGKIDFFIFKVKQEICPTYKFLLEAKDEGYILTGVKGIALLFLNNNKELPKDSWILSPNRILSLEDYWKHAAVPYFVSENNEGHLNSSNHSVTHIPDRMYIVLGKKIVS